MPEKGKLRDGMKASKVAFKVSLVTHEKFGASPQRQVSEPTVTTSAG